MQEETRREFLKNTKNCLSLLAFPYIVSAKEGPTKTISHNFKLVSKTVFMPAPAQNVGVHAASCYTDRKKNDLISIHSHTSKSDLNDAAFFRFSSDNGQTWSEAARWYTKFEHPNGTGRRYPRAGIVDPNTNKFILFYNKAVLPNDDPLEGMQQLKIHYTILNEKYQFEPGQQIIHRGVDFDEIHPFPDIYIGRNCYMLGDYTQAPLFLPDGTLLLPVQSTPLVDDKYFNPGGGMTYTDCMLLMGRWNSENQLEWTCSERIKGNPAETTRGLIEPTIALLADQSLLMVMRGSNDVNPELPGYKWYARSFDGGHTWTKAQPWTYSTGENFYSPSSCSQLLPHSNKKLYWIGNITPDNPIGHHPRFPLVIGEVDLESGLLIKDSVFVIDDKQINESDFLFLSNFYAREDRETGDIVLHLSRLFANDFRNNDKIDWTADALLYRTRV